ncbi:MAG TPA: PLP-dependent transferase [Kofleriaceae bacterium]|nr:PLP-dependent transferase [Kofleriaceae bacterium]
MTTNGDLHLGPDFAASLAKALPALLAPGALPDDWDHRATTYDLPRFDSDVDFASRFEAALSDVVASSELRAPDQLRQRLAAVGLPFDYARLGQPLSTVYELYMQSRTNAARCFSFASVTKPWLAVIESTTRSLPVRIYARATLPISDEKRRALQRGGCELHEQWRQDLPPRAADVLTVLVTESPFVGDIQTSAADAVCFAVSHGGVLLIRDAARISPYGIQLIRKRTVAALLAADARAELERAAGLTPTTLAAATPAECEKKLRGLFPQIHDSLYFCTGLAAEAAVFTAVADVLGPEPVTLFYAQNGYGGTGQLIADLLARGGAIRPAPLAVIAQDTSVTLVDRVLAALEALGGAPAFVFLETPTNPELQVHDFAALMTGVRAYAQRWGTKVPIIVDTTLAPLYPIFAKDFAQDWPFILVKSGSKYFTKGKATLGVVACAANPTALAIVARARALGQDADSFARPAQLAELSAGLEDLVPRMAAISAHTIRLASALRAALRAHGHEITLYAISKEQVADGLATGMLSFYLPPAPTTYPDLVDEFVAYLLEHAPTLVKSRVSYGQSTGGGKPDYFYVINPEESTQGALSAEVKNAQKHDNVQICRISVPEHADVDGLVAAMNGFFAVKYARASK